MSRRNSNACPKRDPKTGTWYFVIDGGETNDGRRKQIRRRGFATKKAAQAELNRLAGAVDRDAHVDITAMTVGDFLEQWLSSTLPLTVASSTAFSYRSNMQRHVIDRIGSVRLQRLSGPTLNRLYTDLLEPGANLRSPERGLSRRTVRYVHTILHRALGDAVRHGLLVRNPADLADPPSVKASAPRRDKVRTWTAAELSTFLRRSDAEGDRDFALWRLIASTGMRRGEAVGLRWGDVDLDAGTVTITRALTVTNHIVEISAPKTTSGSRSIALDSRTVAALIAHQAVRANERELLGIGPSALTDYVAGAADGSFLHPEAASKRFDRRAARYGLPHIGVHGLRHTWATLALRAGVHPKVVQERLGHSSITVTLGIYSHVTDGLDLGAAEQVAALFDPSPSVDPRSHDAGDCADLL
jgi:integrase